MSDRIPSLKANHQCIVKANKIQTLSNKEYNSHMQSVLVTYISYIAFE